MQGHKSQIRKQNELNFSISFNCYSEKVFQVLKRNYCLSGITLYPLFDFLLKLYTSLFQILDFVLVRATYTLPQRQLSLQCQLVLRLMFHFTLTSSFALLPL